MALFYSYKTCFIKKMYKFNHKHYSFALKLSLVPIQMIGCMKIKGFTAKRCQVFNGQNVVDDSFIKSHLPQWALNKHNKCKEVCWVRPIIYNYLVPNCSINLLFMGV